jgi:hypothetical protein
VERVSPTVLKAVLVSWIMIIVVVVGLSVFFYHLDAKTSTAQKSSITAMRMARDKAVPQIHLHDCRVTIYVTEGEIVIEEEGGGDE